MFAGHRPGDRSRPQIPSVKYIPSVGKALAFVDDMWVERYTQRRLLNAAVRKSGSPGVLWVWHWFRDHPLDERHNHRITMYFNAERRTLKELISPNYPRKKHFTTESRRHGGEKYRAEKDFEHERVSLCQSPIRGSSSSSSSSSSAAAAAAAAAADSKRKLFSPQCLRASVVNSTAFSRIICSAGSRARSLAKRPARRVLLRDQLRVSNVFYKSPVLHR